MKWDIKHDRAKRSRIKKTEKKEASGHGEND